jgi:predicted GNAT family N-acyltransferase
MYQYIFKTWADASSIAYPIRHQVFVVEQRIPIELEIDEHDSVAQHLILLLNQKPIGTARIFPANHQSNDYFKIGRLAILKEHRQQGLGSKMMGVLINYAEIHQYKKISLHAQVDALGFYEKLGFIAEELEFNEGGILHRECIKYSAQIT